MPYCKTPEISIEIRVRLHGISETDEFLVLSQFTVYCMACIRNLYRRVCVCLCVCVCILPTVYTSEGYQIWTTFGTRMEIHLEMVMGEIKITPCDLGGIWGGFRGQKITNLE